MSSNSDGNLNNYLVAVLILSIIHCVISIFMIIISSIVKERKQTSIWVISFIIFIVVGIISGLSIHTNSENESDTTKISIPVSNVSIPNTKKIRKENNLDNNSENPYLNLELERKHYNNVKFSKNNKNPYKKNYN